MAIPTVPSPIRMSNLAAEWKGNANDGLSGYYRDYGLVKTQDINVSNVPLHTDVNPPAIKFSQFSGARRFTQVIVGGWSVSGGNWIGDGVQTDDGMATFWYTTIPKFDCVAFNGKRVVAITGNVSFYATDYAPGNTTLTWQGGAILPSGFDAGAWDYRKLAWNGVVFVTLGSNCGAYSYDGSNWTKISGLPANIAFYDIACWRGTIFYAVGYKPNGSGGYVATAWTGSSNGQSWTELPMSGPGWSVGSALFFKVCARIGSSNSFLAVGQGGEVIGYDLTAHTLPVPSGYTYQCVAYSNKLDMWIVGAYNISTDLPIIAYATNANINTSWTVISGLAPAAKHFILAFWDEHLETFIVGSNSGVVWASPDGVNWTIKSISTHPSMTFLWYVSI